MISILFKVASFASAASNNFNMSETTMPTNDTEISNVPNMSPECLAQINRNTGLKSCGVGIDDAFNTGAFPTINGQNVTELTQQLDSMCTSSCSTALSILGQDLISTACLTFASAVSDGITSFEAKDIPALLKYARELACSKDGTKYCFPTLASEVGMMGMGFTPESGGSLLSNQTLICSKCFKQEFTAVTIRNYGLFSETLKTALKSGLDRVTEAQEICSSVSSASDYAVISALAINVAYLLI